jgi:hypothetical protein
LDKSVGSFSYDSRLEESSLGRSQYFVFLLLGFYFIVPHHLFFQIIDFREIKPFDLVVPVLLAFYLTKKISFRGLSPLLLLIGLYLLRSFFAVGDIGSITIVYALKLFEYFVVIFCLKDLRPIFINRLVVVYIFAIAVYVVAELLGVEFGLGWGGRLSGQFGGPYEFSSIALLLFLYLGRGIAGRAAFFAMIILSGTKAAYLALVAGLVVNMKPRYSVLTIIFIFLIFFIAMATDERFSIFVSNLATLGSVDIFEILYSMPKVESHDEYIQTFMVRESSTNDELDLSTGTRLYTYLLIVKSIDLNAFFIGHGPGFFGKGVDSSILRIFGEVGVLGLILGYQVMKGLCKDLGGSRSNLVILIVMVALSDVFFSARFLPTLFLLNQYAFFKLHRNS